MVCSVRPKERVRSSCQTGSGTRPLPSIAPELLSRRSRCTVHNLLEQIKHLPQLTDEQRSFIPKALLYIHEVVVTPPEDLTGVDANTRAQELRDFAAFVTEFNNETDRGAALARQPRRDGSL
jgi:hypothetical protein